MAGQKIKLPADPIEMAASIEVAKIISIRALTIASAALADTNFVNFVSEVKGNALAVIANADLEMSPEDAKRFRAYAETAVEELFALFRVEGGSINKLSS
jgi:hypothetical protein